MLGKLAFAAAAAAAQAATWYGMSPDDTIRGQINIFSMTAQGQPLNGAAAVVTSDREYPKINTLHCSWANNNCFFLTGVEAPYTQDALYAVDRKTGRTVWKHEIPAGIYVGNLAYDWDNEMLYGVAFDPRARNALIASWDTKDGNFTAVLDITRDIGPGLVFDGTVSVCSPSGRLYAGVDMPPGIPDVILGYDLAAKKLVERQPTLFPIPSAIRTFCNATRTELLAATIQSDSQARETLLIGGINEQGAEGFFFPFVEAPLPTFGQGPRGDTPLFLNGVMGEFGGQFLVPVTAPFTPGPGPAPPVPFGLVLSATPATRQGSLTPIDYFLAGASGVPNT